MTEIWWTTEQMINSMNFSPNQLNTHPVPQLIVKIELVMSVTVLIAYTTLKPILTPILNLNNQ